MLFGGRGKGGSLHMQLSNFWERRQTVLLKWYRWTRWFNVGFFFYLDNYVHPISACIFLVFSTELFQFCYWNRRMSVLTWFLFLGPTTDIRLFKYKLNKLYKLEFYLYWVFEGWLSERTWDAPIEKFDEKRWDAMSRNLITNLIRPSKIMCVDFDDWLVSTAMFFYLYNLLTTKDIKVLYIKYICS